MNNLQVLMEKAIKLGLFDPAWYQSNHRLPFKSPLEAFYDYIRKSPYSDVAPSSYFDGISYFENNHDVYESGISPLEHYINFGVNEGRKSFPLRPLWVPKHAISHVNLNIDKEIFHEKVAIVLHIFYDDFLQKFSDALFGVFFDFDLYITTTSSYVVDNANLFFSRNPKVKNIKIKFVANHGRNFGPLLVEFGKELLNYDYFCHMHSKKSLYSGKEQTQWVNYLIEYLVKDKTVLTGMLNIFHNNKKYGLYYPVSFWNMPTWTNHWLKNKHRGLLYLKENYDMEFKDDFFAYPVGGMFWARSRALEPILNKKWTYDDFPPEPLASDGTFLHLLERIFPRIVERAGYTQFFYNPCTGQYTEDDSFIFRAYLFGQYERIKNIPSRCQIVSFDVFDTVLMRDLHEPDYAKFLLPEKLGLNISGYDFIKLRNAAELRLRKKMNFDGDIDIYEIYREFENDFHFPIPSKEVADLEFEIDLSMIDGKDTMVNMINALAENGKKIFIITDTYYTENHIRLLLNKSGVLCDFELFVSSKLKLRKDNGTMWGYIKNKLIELGCESNFLHFGDNVVSDSQIPGDFGLKSIHILSPLDKWHALGFPYIKDRFNTNNINFLKKWGPLLRQITANPFI